VANAPRIINEHATELDALCKRFRVRRLEVFGSVVTERFDASRSDLDFLVEFDNPTINDAADRFFGLLHALEDLFARRIDLVDLTAVENPYFLRAIEPSRTVLYAA
jgi:predicted nucleotidyltransferase